MLFRFALLFLLLGCGPNSEKEECLQVSDWQQNLDSLSKPALEQISVALQEKDSLALESGISVLQNVLKQAKASAESLGSSFRFPTLDSFKEMLKSIIYLVENDTLSKQKAILYDGELPSIDVLKDETNCHFFYGILGNINM